MIRVAYFPLKKEYDYLAKQNELIIDYNNRYVYIKSEDDININQYPSKEAIDNISKTITIDIELPQENITGSTYTEIYNNMIDVLNWIKSMKSDIDNNYSINSIIDIMKILDGYEYGHDILEDIDKKMDRELNKTLSDYNFDAYYKNKLDSIQFGANKYYHDRNQQCSYIPPVKSINGYFDHINLTIEDIIGLENVENGANNYIHPKDPVCNLENFGVIAVNGKSGNVNITLKDIGMDKIVDYPITLTSTPKDKINLLSYASLQGVHNVIKNKFAHKNIITPLVNTDKVEVVFTTDNDILIRDNTWYIELKDLRTEGALFDYTGRGFALEKNTSYIWALKANRDDEIASNKSGTLHVGNEDMIIMVGDGTIAKDRDVIIRLNNSDNKWTGSSQNVRRFNIKRVDNGGNPYGPIITTVYKSSSTFNCKLPDGLYAAELIYYDENNDLGRGVKEIDYQVDIFKVEFDKNNTVYVDIKNQNYIPPNYANITIKINVMLKKIVGNYININDSSKVQIRLNDGSYKNHDTSIEEGIKYKAKDLYNEAKDKFEGRVIYTDAEGNEYEPVLWEIDRSFTVSKYSFNVYVEEIEIGKPHAKLMVLLENPITFKDINIKVDVKAISSNNINSYKSNNIINDNSIQHMATSDVDNYLLFSFDDIIIDENKTYYGTVYSGDLQVSNTIILGRTSKNQFEFDPIQSNNHSIEYKYNNNNNILNMGSPSSYYDVDGFNRYEDVRIYLKGSPTAISKSKLEIKRSYVDEATNKIMFSEWEDITKTRSIKIFPNELWSNGERSPRPVQYSIRLSGDNIKVVEVEDNINPYYFGKLKVFTMITELTIPEPSDPENPEMDNKIIVRITPSTFENAVAVIRKSGYNNQWIHGIKITDNSTQHFFELNGRTHVDDFDDFEFNYKLKPNELLDIGVIVGDDETQIIKQNTGVIKADYTGNPTIISNNNYISKNGKIIQYNLSTVEHKTRYNDIRFITNPPDATIEYNIDSVWSHVQDRRLALFKNVSKVPIRVSAYGYLTHEEVVNLWGPSMQRGELKEVKVDLEISPSNVNIYIKIIIPWCAYPNSDSGASYKIFDNGKWVTRKSGDVFSVIGEGKRAIQVLSDGDIEPCFDETIIYNVDYIDEYGPDVPGCSYYNPIVIKIPVTGFGWGPAGQINYKRHSDHSQYYH